MRLALLAAAAAALLAGEGAGLKAVRPDQATRWEPTYDPEHKHRMINTHGPWSDGRIQLPPPSDKFILVVPRLKLLFCFIPKVACTQFNRLINELNGMTHRLGENCGNHDPIFASSVRYGHIIGNKWKWEMMEHPAWTKAVFLRDPLERLVSAHRSKCENDECGGCLEQNFTKGIMEELLVNDNMHYIPQHHFCGNPYQNQTLETMLKHYNFVGHLTNDRAKVAHQVESMLHLALERRQSYSGDSGLLDLAAKGADFTVTRESSDADFTAESLGRLARKHFLNFSGDHADEKSPNERPDDSSRLPADQDTMDDMTEAYFPRSAGLTEYEGDHDTGAGKILTSRYFKKESLEVALEYYARDYRVLPGLHVPAWVDDKLECLKITTGSNTDDSGHLAVTVEIRGRDGPEYAQAASGFFAPGSTVIDKCWGQVLSVRMRSSGSDSWLGSVEWSPDGRVSFGPMRCSNCTAGSSTKTVLVASVGGSRASGQQAQASCLGDAACELLKEPLPPPPPTLAPTPVPTNPENVEGLKTATPPGYVQAGTNCNCGNTVSEWTWEKPSTDLCAKACESVHGCAAFAIWTSAATFDGMCRLFDAPCGFSDGWQPGTTCTQPTQRTGPNVGFNREAGANPGGEAPTAKQQHVQDNAEALTATVLPGYVQMGKNCLCGDRRAEWIKEKDSPEACAAECDKDPGCAAFSVWTNKAKLPGMCRLWDAPCPDDNGWDRTNTECASPTKPQGPNVNFNRRGRRAA